MRKEAYYFTHDSNARHDPKILALRSIYGYLGYGWYFAVIEILRDQQDFKYEISSPFSWNALALELCEEPDKIRKFIDDCVNSFHLFSRDDNFFWSESLLNRMKIKEKKSRLAKKAITARWEKTKGKQKDKADTDVLRTNNGRITIKERKGKENNKGDDQDQEKITEERYQKEIAKNLKELQRREKELENNTR